MFKELVSFFLFCIMKNYVAYYRVSTQKQGASGLGLQAQKDTVNRFAQNYNIIAEFTEIESGKNNQRSELKKAIELANEKNATLLIAKLDRLSRNVSFIFQLRDSKVDFTCCDIPDANTMTIGIFALLAQQERELISERTKNALAEKKRQGFKLGKPENLTDQARLQGRVKYSSLAKENENNRRAFAFIQSLRQQKHSYRAIAEKLNEAGFRTSRGNSFFANSVRQIELLYKN